MTRAPKSGREIEDHRVHNASRFWTKVLGRFSHRSEDDES